MFVACLYVCIFDIDMRMHMIIPILMKSVSQITFVFRLIMDQEDQTCLFRNVGKLFAFHATFLAQIE